MNFKRLFYLSIILVMCASCSEDDGTGQQNDNPNSTQNHDPVAFAQNFGSDISRSFIGTVVDMNNNPIIQASVRIGSSLALTDSNGTFIINNAQVKSRFAYIRVEKSGYINASRSIVPTTGTNKVRIMMLPETVVGTTSSGTQETINLPNGSKVALEGDYIKPDGTDYDGTVNVIMHHLDPADDDMQDQMPGMLYAANAQNEERMLQTFGMLAIELRGENGEDLNLAEGSTAEITLPLDASLMTNAPSSIPLWYFDEANGYWIEEGEATLVGNAYVGTVSHFSFWNCDLPTEVVVFCATFTDADSNPLDNLRVEITSSNFGTTVGFTNENGEVCGYIPSNETLEMDVYANDICNDTSIYNSTIGPFSEDSSLDISLTDFTSPDIITETIAGTFLTCDNNPVTNGYIKITYGSQELYHSVTDGTFELSFVRCSETTSFELEAVDYENLEIAEPQTIPFTTPQTNLGTLQACSALTSEYIQYQFGNNDTSTRPVTFAGINGSGNFQVSFTPQTTFGGTSFVLVINNYTVPGNYPGGLGLGDFSSDVPFSEIYLSLFNEFEGTTTVINFGDIGEIITVNFSGIIRNSSINEEYTLSGQIQAIRDQ